ncbi:hypothetical protein Bca101_026284 [Brassica carinata]
MRCTSIPQGNTTKNQPPRPNEGSRSSNGSFEINRSHHPPSLEMLTGLVGKKCGREDSHIAAGGHGVQLPYCWFLQEASPALRMFLGCARWFRHGRDF